MLKNAKKVLTKHKYILVHACTSLYILVHPCTSLYILVHPCASVYIHVYSLIIISAGYLEANLEGTDGLLYKGRVQKVSQLFKMCDELTDLTNF